MSSSKNENDPRDDKNNDSQSEKLSETSLEVETKLEKSNESLLSSDILVETPASSSTKVNTNDAVSTVHATKASSSGSACNLNPQDESDESSKKGIRRFSEIYEKLTKVFAFPSMGRQPRRPFTTPQTLPAPPSYFAARSSPTTRMGGSPHTPISTTTPMHQISLPPNAPFGQLPTFPNFPNATGNAYGQWAPYPAKIPPNVPPGLALLVDCDVLFVTQQMDFINLLIQNLQDSNFYLVMNKKGEFIYYVRESYDMCLNCNCARCHRLHVMDVYHTEVMFLNLPCSYTHCFCCYPILEVYSPTKVPLGAFLKQFDRKQEVYNIVDPDENVLFKMYANGRWQSPDDFVIYSLDRPQTQVGMIRREFVSLILNGLDYYGVSFPENMDVRIKALILSAVFLIDYAYFDYRYGCQCPCCCCFCI